MDDEADVTEDKVVTLQETGAIDEEEEKIGVIQLNTDEINNKVTQNQFETDVNNKSELIKAEEADGIDNKGKGPSIKYVRKIFGKTNISNPLIRTRTCAYQEVRNVSFSENFAFALNG